MNELSGMKRSGISRKALLWLLASILTVSLSAYGYWSKCCIHGVLAHETPPNGSELCVVQGYKDICEPGWVAGLYQRDPNGVWHLRHSFWKKTPWRRAVIHCAPTASSVTIDNETRELSPNLTPVDPNSNELVKERGYLCDPHMKPSDFPGPLIDTTY